MSFANGTKRNGSGSKQPETALACGGNATPGELTLTPIDPYSLLLWVGTFFPLTNCETFELTFLPYNLKFVKL